MDIVKKDGTILENCKGTITIIFNETVTISFDLNKGTDPKKKHTPKTIIKGSLYTLPENEIQAPDKFEFDCWEIDNKEFTPGTEIRLEKDTIIKAVWKHLPPRYDPIFPVG